MLHVFFDVDKVDADAYALLFQSVPTFLREKTRRYRQRTDRVNSLCAYVLLCLGIGRRVEALSYNEYGKPFLPEGPHFSITHCDGCVAAGVSPSPIGIDAERVCQRPREVAAQFFTPQEIHYIESSPDADTAFFSLWTLKESYCKILGTGLSFNPLCVQFVIDGERITCSDRRFHFAVRSLGRWQLAVCGTETPDITIADLDTFLRKWGQMSGRLC